MKYALPDKKFVVYREKWARGSESALFTEEHTLCCLGFFCNQGGMDLEDLRCVGSPCELGVSVEGLTDECGGDTPLASDAIEINDDPDIDGLVREEKLIKLFSKHGYTIQFEDKEPSDGTTCY